MSVSKKRSCSHMLQNKMNSYQWQSKIRKINKSKGERGTKAGPQGASSAAPAEGGGGRERERKNPALLI